MKEKVTSEIQSKSRARAGTSRNTLACAGLAIITLIVFARVVTHGYVIWDDQLNIYDNPHLSNKALSGLSEFWKGPFEGLFIPVTYTLWSVIAFFANETIDDEISTMPVLNPAFFHASNLIVHLGCVFLVFHLIRRFIGGNDPTAAAAGAALFAIHPLQVEPVAWVTGMKDVLSSFLGLCTIAVYFRKPEKKADAIGGTSRYGPAYWASLVLFTLAILAKPGLVMLPFVLFLLDILILKSSWKSAAAALIPFLVLSLAAGLLTTLVQLAPDEASGAYPVTDPLPFIQRPIVALDALTLYLCKLVYPVGLVTQYDRSPSHAVNMSLHFPIWIVPPLAAAALLRIRRNRNYYLAGFGLGVVLLFPVLGFVPFGFQRVSTIADRYMYFPMFGIGLALAAWLADSKGLAPRVVAGIAIAVFTVISFIQVPVWEGPTSLFTHTYKINTRSVAAATNLGAAAFNTGNYAEALKHYERLLTINKDNPESYNIVGHLYNQIGKPEEAVRYLQMSLELDPNRGEAYLNLGISRFSLGEFESAVSLFQKALDFDPDSPDLLVNLGAALTNLDRHDEAIECFRKAAELDSSLWQPYKGLGSIFMAHNRFAEALDAFTHALQIARNTPGFPETSLRDLEMQYETARVRLNP